MGRFSNLREAYLYKDYRETMSHEGKFRFLLVRSAPGQNY